MTCLKVAVIILGFCGVAVFLIATIAVFIRDRGKGP